MKTAFSKSICSLTGLLLALALTLSCSGGDDNPDGGGGSVDDGWQEYQERLKYYDPDDTDKRCQNGVLEERCEDNGREVWYNPLTNICNYSESCSSGEDGGYSCERTYYGLGTIELCGNVHYVSSNSRRCVGGVLQRKCGDVWYNRETHYCDYEYNPNTGTETSTLKAKELCGNKYYEPDYSTSWGSDGVAVREPNTRCQNGIVQEKCGWGENVTWYNSETEYCSFDPTNMTQIVKPRVLCGGEYLDGDYEKCDNGVILSRCGGNMPSVPGGDPVEPVWYNYITQTCVESGNWQTGYTYTVRNKVRCGN